MGEVITFFSYKGGVGRSMALANVAVLLARWGHRVLIVDWDLEAPGLEGFFKDHLDLELAARTPGVIDLLYQGYEVTGELAEISFWHDYALPIAIPEAGGTLHLMTAGQKNESYFHKVQSLDVRTLYEKQNGGEFVELLRRDWKKSYDFVLIDSRTGITDIGGICTVQMPDRLVVLFTATEQALRGVVEVVEKAERARRKLPYERLQVPAIPIPSRFDGLAEYEISQEWLGRFERELAPLYASWLPTSIKRREFLEITKIPYASYFSFGEKLPVLEQGITDPAALGHAYANLAALLANGLDDVELLLEDRGDFLKAAQTLGPVKRDRVLICHTEKDRPWLERLLPLLHSTKLERNLDIWNEDSLNALYRDGRLQTAMQDNAAILLLVSSDFLASDFLILETFGRWVEAVAERGTVVVPIILGSAARPRAPWLAGQEAFPETGPLSSLLDRQVESAFADLAVEVADLLELVQRPRALEESPERPSFDVFIVEAAKGEPGAVDKIAHGLEARGLKVWLERRSLRPGSHWKQATAAAMEHSHAAMVIVEPDRDLPWKLPVHRTGLLEFAKKGQPIIPVLMPGIEEPPALPLFMRDLTWVDLRGCSAEEGLDQLEWGITGVKPGDRAREGGPSAV